MASNIRACLWLLVLTVLLCSVIYPLTLLGIGQAFFRDKAEGSIILGPDNKPVGSRLIGQPFNGDEYFQPRPSATTPAYNAAASGASNWAASNPLLRDRVAQALGPIVKYRGGPKKGELVGKDIETWFAAQPPDYAARWAKDHSALAEQWVKDHTDAVANWLKKDANDVKAEPGKAASEFFDAYVKQHPGTWPSDEDSKDAEGKVTKVIKPLRDGTDVQKYLFDPWLQEHTDADLEQVPADLVMASGSGLDPHITLANAHYQMDRVVDAWAKKNKSDNENIEREQRARIRDIISKILEEHKEAPLGGLVGVPLINVLEVNLALDQRLRNRSAALLETK